jgi:glycosyltransferase involved in cell wall biosynthesis
MPLPVDCGIAVYLEGLLTSPLAEHYTISTLDVRQRQGGSHSAVQRWAAAATQAVRLRRQLRRSPVDVVHLHTTASGIGDMALLARVAAAAKTASVLHVHDDPTTRDDGRLSRAAAVAIASEAWKPHCARWLAPQRLHVLPPAVLVPHVMPRVARQQGPVRIVCWGACSVRGLGALGQALARLVRDGVRNFHVDLVGGEADFGETIRTRKWFRKHAVDDWVTFHGWQADRRVFLRQADVSVSPLASGDSWIASLEALAHGVPVIAPRDGAVDASITEGEHGLLFEPHDVTSLTAALRQLIEDAAQRARLGAAARQRALVPDWPHDWQHAWQGLDRLYREVLTGALPQKNRA